MNKSYSEKLKDPRWQRRRLEIMQRDNFTCSGCASTTKTLHVHHSNGYRNIEPWEYGDNELKTLCEDCHDAEHTPIPSIVFYFAGKISSENNWRKSIIPDLSEVEKDHELPSSYRNKYLKNAIRKRHSYVGPFFSKMEHCEDVHGYLAAACAHNGNTAKEEVLDNSLTQIGRCKVLFAWIDSTDCYGTLAEIGYARALGKQICTAFSNELSDEEIADFWFVREMGLETYAPSAAEAFENILKYLEKPSFRKALLKITT